MKLPHAAEAVVPQNKLENYLLHLGHPIGGGKARFFRRFGFRREDWPALAAALKQHALDNSVAGCSEDSDGTIYLVEVPLNTPSGRAPSVRSVWLIETGELAPRLISAYPLDS